MDTIVAVLVLMVVVLPVALVARHHARLGIIVHPGATGPDPSMPRESGEDMASDEAQFARRESEWRHWYQLGSS